MDVTGDLGEAGDREPDDESGLDDGELQPFDDGSPADEADADGADPALGPPYDIENDERSDEAADDPVADDEPAPVHGAPAVVGGATPWRDSLIADQPPQRRRRRAMVGLAAVLLAGTGIAVVLATRAGDDGGAATPVTTAGQQVLGTSVVPSSSTATTSAATTTTPAATTTTVASTTTTTPTAAPTTAPPATGNASAAQDAGIPNLYTPVRWAIYQGGKVRLLGRVPSQQIADTIATKAVAVVGEGNVSVEYVIDPTAPLPPAAPLYVRDTVQFGPDSDVVAPQFRPLLELGVRLMQQNAGVRIWVLGRADSDGDARANLLLSLRRSQAVIAYVTAAGIDESRLFAVPLGTDAALGDNATAEGRQQNRSVEFVIAGLLS